MLKHIDTQLDERLYNSTTCDCDRLFCADESAQDKRLSRHKG